MRINLKNINEIKREKNKNTRMDLSKINPLLNVAKKYINNMKLFHNKCIMKFMLFGNNMNK